MQTMINKTKFIYDFVKVGSKVTVDEAANQFHFDVEGTKRFYDISSTLILDVGNCLTKGVVDIHHIENGFEWENERIVSTAKLLTKFPSLLDNLSQDIQVVNIIVHLNPDFDCFAATYLAEYYIQYRQFPENYQEIVEYAEKIDSGRLKLNPNQVFNPYTITHVLDQTVGDKRFNSYLEYQTAYLQKGLDLIDYIFKRLPELVESERSIYSPTLFKDNHPFQVEKRLIEEDYKKYQNDLKTICEKRKMRLPTIKGFNKEVDGLFWNKISTCSLDRLWARSDKSSPSGNGYVFTFVPKNKYKTSREILNKFENTSVRILETIKTTNHVIISVDGNSDVTLVDLGKRLELEERKMEDTIFGIELKEKWRTREPKERRFYEEWFDNNDPWYDGRNNQYQIVDTPRIGSLLSITQIKETVLNYTKPRVKQSHSKILFPFQFRTKDFKKLRKSLIKNTNFDPVNLMEDKKLVNYFRPYIREYLFNSLKSKNGYSFTFNNTKKFQLQLSIENRKIISGKIYNGVVNEASDDILLEVGNITILLFRYGIGFVVVETNMVSENYEQDLLLDLLLEVNKELCEGNSAKEIIAFNKLLLGKKINKWIEEYGEGLMYSDVTLNTSSYFEDAKQELLYRLCSHTEWSSTIHTNNTKMSKALERMYYDINEDIIMGFSKKGCVLLIFENNTDNLSEEQLREYNGEVALEKEKFHKWNYYIFLMVLHQCYGLMNFSKELSQIGVKSRVREVSNLRESMFEFIIQGWFSQITNNEIGMDIHKKWMAIFETQTLHDEVLEQVSTIAEYQNAKKNSAFSFKFNIVSFCFLIITGVTGFFGMNISLIDKYKDNEAALWFSFYSLLGVLGFWGIISGGYWLVNKIKKF